MEHDARPWGEYFVLDVSPTHKVKRIVVKPEGRLSYQYHHHRSEIWTIVQGSAIITLDGVESAYSTGEVVQIPLGARHRIQNPGMIELVFIEVQIGTYFGEDDIVRIEDDYNRK